MARMLGPGAIAKMHVSEYDGKQRDGVEDFAQLHRRWRQCSDLSSFAVKTPSLIEIASSPT
jgi:hypothetical protein